MPPTFFVIVVGASFEYPNNLSKQYYINYQANKKPNDKISKKRKKNALKSVWQRFAVQIAACKTI